MTTTATAPRNRHEQRPSPGSRFVSARSSAESKARAIRSSGPQKDLSTKKSANKPTERKAASKPGERAKSRSAQGVATKKNSTDQVHLVVHHRRRLSTRAVVIASVMSFFVVLLMAVSVQSLRAQSDRRLDTLNQGIRVETERYLELRAKLAEKESPARVMDKARSLGMIDPGPVAPLASPGGVAEDDSQGSA